MNKFAADIALAVRDVLKDPMFLARLQYNTSGKIFWVIQTSDAGYSDFVKAHPHYEDGTPSVYNSLEDAYNNAAVTNRDDVILLSACGNAHQLSEMLDWDKNRIQLIGMGASGAVDMQPEIQLSSTANGEDNAATIKMTGYGNMFTNVFISNDGTHGNSVTALWDAGENTVYTNCQFAKFSDLGVEAVSDVEARGDTTTWVRCKFGVSWLVQTVARPTLWIKGTGAGARMKHNVFIDCIFVCASTEVLKHFVEIYDSASLAFDNVMINPVFLSAVVGSIGAVTIDNVVDSVSGLSEGTLLFINPAFNTTLFCDTGQNHTGIHVVGPTSASDVGEPQTPAGS